MRLSFVLFQNAVLTAGLSMICAVSADTLLANNNARVR